MTRDQLLGLAKSRLEPYPTVLSVFTPSWLEERLAFPAARGMHPFVDWLTAPEVFQADLENSLTTLDDVIKTLKNHRNVGRIQSRFNLLKGSKNRTWQNQFRDWQSTLYELFLGAWLLACGYDVKFDGGPTGGADLRVSEKGAEICTLEVHAPRRNVWLSELNNRLRWSNTGDYNVSFDISNEEIRLDESELDGIMSEIKLREIELETTQRKAVSFEFSNNTGIINIKVGPEKDGIISERTGARFVPHFSSLFYDLISRANAKADKGQTSEDIPSLLAIEMSLGSPHFKDQSLWKVFPPIS